MANSLQAVRPQNQPVPSQLQVQPTQPENNPFRPEGQLARNNPFRPENQLSQPQVQFYYRINQPGQN